MPAITSIQNRTHKILNRFIKDIASIKVNNDFERINLYRETKKLFNMLETLGVEEFAKIFKVYNFTSMDIQENEKHQEVLNYLITLIIQKYPETDLLRYFLPDYLSQKETRPESSHYSSRINYWFQLIGYWLRQLVNKPVYALKTEHTNFADPIKYIKASLVTNIPYIVNLVNTEFKNHLAILREKIQKNSIFPKINKINRVNLINDQAYHQQLLAQEKELESMVKTFKEREVELGKKEDILIRIDEDIKVREERVAQNERKNAEVSKLYREEREIFKKEKQAFKTENTMLQEKNLDLEAQLDEKKQIIRTFAEKEQAFEERLSTITATVEKKLQDEKEVLLQQQEKLLEKDQLLQERLNALTINEENFRERNGLLIQDRQEIEKQKKDLENEVKTLKETISKLKENKSDEKNYIKLIEDENFKLLTGIQELVNDGDVVSSTSSGVSSGSIGSEQSLQGSSSAFFKQAAANNPDLQSPTITLVK